MAQPLMQPEPGTRMVRYVGDRVRFAISATDPGEGPWRAMLRTTLGRGRQLRDEIIAAIGAGEPFAGSAWRDIELQKTADGWAIELTLTEPGFFRAKPYLVDDKGWQRWPDGHDIGLCIHANSLRTANSIYCAFVRAFGVTKSQATTRHALLEDQLSALDKHGYSVIPPSGTLRQLTAEVPHIIERLGCRILHLLPINPTPTTYARFGRFGSPYAALDFTAIDPAVVEFDQKTTAIDQFRELSYAVHLRGARLFLDLAINHTGWGSFLLNEHPEWFRRNADGTFHSPGAWGNTWADLVELDHRFPALWDHLAEAFLTWCRRGVDGFRCDAGYMLPTPAWQYITARVRQEFPSTVFLLEGLGGGWDDTERLLTDGGMQWAYSELFQNYSGREVSAYLDHAFRQSERVGTLIHYSETHDNNRLAQGGKTWSLQRNRLSALTSVCGGFGFSCGVEWLATEKIDVHQSRGLNWGAPDHIVGDLAMLNRLLAEHPAFFDGAKLARLSVPESPVFALRRTGADGRNGLLILANLDPANAQSVTIETLAYEDLGRPTIDLLDSQAVVITNDHGAITLKVPAGQVSCLTATRTPTGMSGSDYRRGRTQAAFAIQVLAQALTIEDIGAHDWTALAALVDADPHDFLGRVSRIDRAAARTDLVGALRAADVRADLPRVTLWTLADQQRIRLVPPGHWLLIQDSSPFNATLHTNVSQLQHVRSIPTRRGFVACFAPQSQRQALDATITLERFVAEGAQVRATVRLLGTIPNLASARPDQGLALLTNGRGAMARLHADLGQIASKYDCLLGANLHPDVPCDRHVLAKRLRAWVNADGFITALNRHNLLAFEAGPPARWHFLANAGDGRTVPITLTIDLIEGRNTVAIRWERSASAPAGTSLPADRQVHVTMRVDVEDRSFHAETQRTDGADHHFRTHTRSNPHGFVFAPATDRVLTVAADGGEFHSEPEWCCHIGHPIDAERGQAGSGDAWSPGWFSLPLPAGDSVRVVVSAELEAPHPDAVRGFADTRATRMTGITEQAKVGQDALAAMLAKACDAFVVRRNQLKTVIAGYPWFLDWGRDTLISARGLLAAGLIDEVHDLVLAFAKLERDGTLPNVLYGDNDANRDTTDAPLWFGVVVEELAVHRPNLYATPVDGKRTIADVLGSIARGYLRGTPNGIRVDLPSGLVYSPAHFTWMDTNHPACTPREGYPVEIQALWIRLLRHLERMKIPSTGEPWWPIADRATASLKRRYWIDELGWLADNLIAPAGVPADQAIRDDALRSNGLIAACFGFLDQDQARRLVLACEQHLVVPGALRSLAPLAIKPPLRINGPGGHPLMDPDRPYQGQYVGDEDTRRKPAYHNGTAWTWTFPMFCEAMALAWDFAPSATAAARAYLGSVDRLLADGCVGHLPEITDGDAPHTHRGCDAQAWGVCEALRVLTLFNTHGSKHS